MSNKPINLLDLMSDKDRQAARKNYERRLAGETPDHRMKVTPAAMIMAEAGIMFGWQAIVDIKRGCTDGDIPLTLEEVSLLTEAGRKVQYSMEINAARGTQVAVSSALSKTPKKTFDEGMKQQIKEVKEVRA